MKGRGRSDEERKRKGSKLENVEMECREVEEVRGGRRSLSEGSRGRRESGASREREDDGRRDKKCGARGARKEGHGRSMQCLPFDQLPKLPINLC